MLLSVRVQRRATLLDLVCSLVKSKRFFLPRVYGQLLHVLHIFIGLDWSLSSISEISYIKESNSWPFTTTSTQGPALEMDMPVNYSHSLFGRHVCSHMKSWHLHVQLQSWICHIRNKPTFTHVPEWSIGLLTTPLTKVHGSTHHPPLPPWLKHKVL